MTEPTLYKVTGTCRRIGAIGTPDNFVALTIAQSQTENAARAHAADDVRTKLSEFYTHILVTDVVALVTPLIIL